MVKVGNSECEFLKLTPLSRISAIAGAICGVTMRPRKPSGTNRMRLRGWLFWADAAPADSAIRPADSNKVARRIKLSPSEANSGLGRRLCLIFLYDGIVTCAVLIGNLPPESPLAGLPGAWRFNLPITHFPNGLL